MSDIYERVRQEHAQRMRRIDRVGLALTVVVVLAGLVALVW